MRTFSAAICAALLLFGQTDPAAAQDVTLTSRDGAVELSGTLLGFDGDYYRLDTIYGELTVDGSGVNCDGPGCPNLSNFVAELRLSGSSVIGQNLMPLLIEGFARVNGYLVQRTQIDATHVEFKLAQRETERTIARFYLRATTANEGFADLLANEADIMMSVREVHRDEVQIAQDAGMGNLEAPGRSRVLALDALVTLVAPENPLRSLSLNDLARVLTGQIDNWADLGGPDAPIDLYVPPIGSGHDQALYDLVLAPVQGNLRADAIRVPGSRDLVQRVLDDPLGLGIASFAALGAARPLTLSGSCGSVLSANRQTIKTEDYPLSAPMFLYVPARRLPKLAREFLAFTRTPLAQMVIRRGGLVDQAPEETPLNNQGDRLVNAIRVTTDKDVTLADLQRLIQTFDQRKRLSFSFRFEPGSARLDAQSRSNVQLLAQQLEAGDYDTRHLIFAGFSDGIGPADANRRISSQRAQAVLSAVRNAAETADFDRVTLTAETFGEVLPMACDDTEWGRRVNRRVEIWID